MFNKKVLNKVTIFTLACSLFLGVSADPDPNAYCTALVLSGGGSNGAWEAGVIWGLLHYGDPADYKYDVVAGVSAGSINSALLAGWEVGDEYKASEYVSDQWDTIRTADVWKMWKGGMIAGLIHPGMVDTSNGLEYLNSVLAEFGEFKRRVSIAATDINTGEVVTFTDKDLSWDELGQATLSSASVPGAFPPQKFKGHLLVDGMTAWNLNAEQAVKRCKEVTSNEKNITIDIVICGVTDAAEERSETKKTLNNYQRARTIKAQKNGKDAIDEQMRAHPDIHWRHIIMETTGYATGKDELSFDPEVTRPLQEQGRKDAQAAIAMLANPN